jgi:DNA-binding NtrC family response regulator
VSGERTTKSILIVEDHHDFRRVLHEGLAERGFDVVSAYSGADALRALMLRSAPLDVALIDIRLPESSGLELANVLWNRWPKLPVIYMSGKSLTAEETALVGSLNFLSKPFGLDALVSLIETVHEGNRLVTIVADVGEERLSNG